MRNLKRTGLLCLLLGVVNCQGEKPKAASPSTNTYPYTYPTGTSVSLDTSGTFRIELNGSLTGTLQAVAGTPVTWTFQAFSASSTGSAVIYSVTSSASRLTVQESDTQTATVSGTLQSSDGSTGTVTVKARDMTACAVATTTCSDFNTTTPNDLTQTFTWTMTGSSTSSIGSSLGMGMLLGGLTGLVSSGGNVGTALKSGLSMSMNLMMLQNMANSGYGTSSVPYSGLGTLGYGTTGTMGYGTTPYTSYSPYATSPYGANQYGTGASNCSSYPLSTCSSIPGCVSNGISCVSSAIGSSAALCANYTNNSIACNANTSCLWIPSIGTSGTCRSR